MSAGKLILIAIAAHANCGVYKYACEGYTVASHSSLCMRSCLYTHCGFEEKVYCRTDGVGNSPFKCGRSI